MRRSFVRFVLGAVALAAPLFMAEKAEAGVCGWMADGQVECELDVTGGCEARCTPIHVEAQCGFSCEAECDVQVNAECSVGCQADCMADCTPGKIDCQGSCEAHCGVDCDAYCEAGAGHASCVAKCEGNCGASCSGHCSVKPASCEASCKASCEGSCSASVNVDCQANCQGGCSSEITGGCKVACREPEGALFCDGQYVQFDNINDCELFVEFEADGHCDGSGCEGVASCTACSTSGSANSPFDASAIAAMALGVGLIVSRRRNKKSA